MRVRVRIRVRVQGGVRVGRRVWVRVRVSVRVRANGLSIFFIFSKNQLLVLLVFAIVSFISFSFISDLIFMMSFLLLTLGFFVLLSLIALGCLFEMFLVS